jgi:hypothetical protein
MTVSFNAENQLFVVDFDWGRGRLIETKQRIEACETVPLTLYIAAKDINSTKGQICTQITYK